MTSSVVAMCLSFISLLKTTYDLQEVDRYENAVSSPHNLIKYFTTSILWFSSTLIFRCLSVSILSLYLSQYVDLRGIALVPILAIAAGNVLLRSSWVTKGLRSYSGGSGALLNGFMASIAPAKFMRSSLKDSATDLTRSYLIHYVTYNTITHLIGLGVVCAINHDRSFDENILAKKKWIHVGVLPVLALLCLISVLTAIVHWTSSGAALQNRIQISEFSKRAGQSKFISQKLENQRRSKIQAKRAGQKRLLLHEFNKGLAHRLLRLRPNDTRVGLF